MMILLNLHKNNFHKVFPTFRTAQICSLILLSILSLFGLDVSAQKAKEIKCSLSLNDRALEVKIEMPANRFEKTGFSLTNWGGQANYADNVYRLAAADKTGAVLMVEKNGERDFTVKNQKKAFEITYTIVVQKDDFMGNNKRNHFHPTLFKNYVFLWGSSFLLYPKAAEIATLPTLLQIAGNEYGVVYTNFKEKAASFDDLRELFIAAGDYRVTEKQIGNRKIKFLLQGKNWKFSDEQFIGAVTQIIEAQTKYMGFYPTSDDLLVTLNEGTANSHGGTVVKNVISVYPNTQTELKDFEMLKLIAHEHFHFWNSSYLHAAEDKPEGYYKWLSEGFTEYYAGLTLYRENLIGEKEFTAWINNLLLEYQTNPHALTATAEVLAENYWKSNDYSRLPYIKGALIALFMDSEIRRKTAGAKQIDDFMRRMMSEIDRKKGFDDRQVLMIFNTLTKTNARQFYDDFILGAKLLPVVEVLKNGSINVSPQQREVFELGFATETGRLERGAKLKQVFASSGAEKAGLRTGDEIKSMSFTYGKPNDEASITIIRENQAIPVKYYPRKTIEILQIDETAVLPK